MGERRVTVLAGGVRKGVIPLRRHEYPGRAELRQLVGLILGVEHALDSAESWAIESMDHPEQVEHCRERQRDAHHEAERGLNRAHDLMHRILTLGLVKPKI